MQLDEGRHVVDEVLGVLQFGHAGARHARAHHVVEAKRHALVGDGPGIGFGDVVKERGQSQRQVGRRLVDHRPGVLEHVLVLMDRVLFQLQFGQFGEEVLRQTRAHDEVQTHRRLRAQQQQVEFAAHAFGRDFLELLGHRRSGRLHRGINGQRESCGESRGAQHAQRIVTKEHLGIDRRSQRTIGQVLKPAEVVEQGLHPGSVVIHGNHVQCEGIDGEIAPREVGLEGIAPLHRRFTRVIDVGLGAKRRHLGFDIALAQRATDGPKGPTLLPERAGQGFHQPFNVVGPGVRREVDLEVLAPLDAEQRISHRAAHGVEGEARVRERVGERTREMREIAQCVVSVGEGSHCERRVVAPGCAPTRR